MENKQKSSDEVHSQENKMDSAPILILEGSKQPYLSVGRHYGGVKAFGYEYLYMPIQDAFLRKDFVKKFNKHKKDGGDWNSFIDYVKSYG